ncbi:hypothetical protein [Rhizobacter sp. Root1221]|uniref:hypothetical protein n=1 Tax=Rhizobacter sp. Root1221 TaxID=1736433 RepID=UPI0006F49210|nr:hypothetical protein [Rhizobacter sp. Root1221]KQV99956.1 hypothetical protein ASC87_19845 [Rhizobacter sp. Root1221]
MTEKTNEPVIRAAFEQCLVDGLKGQPVVTKDGPVRDNDGELMMGPPDSSFLSVVRAYLKDLCGIGEPKDKPAPIQAGQPRGALAAFAKGQGLPFQ